MTHIGKIGRLSQTRRDQLGQRIEDGLPGVEIIDWLNQQPDVHQVLADHFDGHPITEQNLSDWRTSGHLEWRRQAEASQTLRALAEEAAELQDLATRRQLIDQFALVLIVELYRQGMQLLAAETDPEKRWQRLCRINRELAQLRRLDLATARQRMDEERNQKEIHQNPEAGPRSGFAIETPASGGEPATSRERPTPSAALPIGLPNETHSSTTPAPKAAPAPAVSRPTRPATPSTQPKSRPNLFLPPIDLTVPAKFGLHAGKSNLIVLNHEP
jgi:hypothetical protein